MPGILGQVQEYQGRKFAQLKEDGSKAKLKDVKIFDIPEKSILIKLDKSEQPKTLFSSYRGQRKRCDYVLLTAYKGQYYMLFIEMKSEKLKNKDIEQQFKASECIMDYCEAMLNRFHEQDDLLASFKKRFIVFYKLPSIPKRPTRPLCKKRLNDKPEEAMKYPSPQKPSIRCLLETQQIAKQ